MARYAACIAEPHLRGPNTFIIGAPKAGTTSLAAYLGSHPGAFVCTPKEPFFWSDDYPGLAQRLGIASLDDYHALFRPADSRHAVIAEASTNYLCSRTAVERILRYNPDSRFIVMLRDPVEVVHAFHMEQVFAGNEDVRDFESAWRLQEERRLGRALPRGNWSPQFLQYGSLAHFGEQTARLLERVRRDALLFLRFEDFRDDVAACWASVQAFLGLPPDGRTAFPVGNAAHGHRFPALARWMHEPHPLLKSAVDGLRMHLRRRRYPLVEALKSGLRRPAARAPLDTRFERELRAGFAPDIERLQSLLGWDLSDWTREERRCLPS